MNNTLLSWPSLRLVKLEPLLLRNKLAFLMKIEIELAFLDGNLATSPKPCANAPNRTVELTCAHRSSCPCTGGAVIPWAGGRGGAGWTRQPPGHLWSPSPCWMCALALGNR